WIWFVDRLLRKNFNDSTTTSLLLTNLMIIGKNDERSVATSAKARFKSRSQRDAFDIHNINIFAFLKPLLKSTKKSKIRHHKSKMFPLPLLSSEGVSIWSHLTFSLNFESYGKSMSGYRKNSNAWPQGFALKRQNQAPFSTQFAD